MVVLCAAVIRVQRTLNHTILDKSAPKDLSCFVSREVADRTTSSDRVIHPGDKESCVGGVIFTNLEGFTTLSK
ncbi:MAG: adenylate/guanylate cyclase domain-containing protein, partial [Rhodospirillales bacterium]|nr:adenylate/guanylate cyclase domain-containing protein [Rhodospirillales bacterium]